MGRPALYDYAKVATILTEILVERSLAEFKVADIVNQFEKRIKDKYREDTGKEINTNLNLTLRQAIAIDIRDAGQKNAPSQFRDLQQHGHYGFESLQDAGNPPAQTPVGQDPSPEESLAKAIRAYNAVTQKTFLQRLSDMKAKLGQGPQSDLALKQFY
ncbi:MAG: hypothetical protein HY681_11155 [Chloroflexi bacterium]|nr:hypothetical protein [Chloroflexota bacterium]